MKIASVTAKRATCLRRSVGCVLLDKDGFILATGYNGVAAGQPHCNEAKNVPVYHDDPRVTFRPFEDQFVFDGIRSQRMIGLNLAPMHNGSKYWLNVGFDRQSVGFDKIHPHACVGSQAPSGTALDTCGAIHAEQNALLRCRDVREIDAAYVTASPCMHCTKMLLNTGCQRIVFLEEYPAVGAKELWLGAGRAWEKYQEV